MLLELGILAWTRDVNFLSIVMGIGKGRMYRCVPVMCVQMLPKTNLGPVSFICSNIGERLLAEAEMT